MYFCQFIIKLSISAILGVLLGITAFTYIGSDGYFSKLTPEYTGVDSKAAPYVDEYLSLAKSNGISFNHVVTIGFKVIKVDPGQYKTVGLTNYGANFREIDLDQQYWDGATKISRMVLLYHELGHSYCNRGHDYGRDKEYGSAEKREKERTKENGFYSDGCPLSIQYPVMVPDDCTAAHYADYSLEMFQNCSPY